MTNYLEQLNQSQLQAVSNLDGPMMVIAGPGSGKTRVLTFRIAHLIKSGTDAFNILALTFTNKAAKEMRNRIETIVESTEARNLWMGTFHGVFSKMLRVEAEKINYTSNFTIYDTTDSKSLIKSIIKEMGLDKDIYKPGLIQNRISGLKNNFITPKDYGNSPELLQTDKIAKRDAFGSIYQKYNQRCFKSGAMDFDDLLLNTYHLLNEFPDVLYKYQNKFKYILVDEYQDTNHVQYLIIKKLAALNENICVVGDDAQSIYSFRGANIQNILNFKVDYPDFKTFKLEQNYRSTSNIVNLANSLITHNKKQIEKEVWTENNSGEKIIICKTLNDNEEGRIVANTIWELYFKQNAKFNEFAILYRTNAQSRALEESLRKKNIPYKIYGGLSFYARKEVKDVLAYFRMCINPKDEESLKRIINYPTRGIGNTTLQKLIIAANINEISIWEVILNLEKYKVTINKGTADKLSQFATLINSYIVQKESLDAYTLAEQIAKTSGVFHNLYSDKSVEGLSRFENLQELLNGIKDFSEKEENNTLEFFMQDVALLTDADNEKEDDYNKVTLMTIHAAKGLEFPFVFVVGLEENLFPSMMAMDGREGLEEERRLFYVAITRAEKRLFLSYALSRFKWGQYTDCKASRFLEELNKKFIKESEIKLSKKPIQKNPYKIFAKTKKAKKSPISIPNNLRKVNTTNAPISPSNTENFQVGTKVKHSRFYNGKILKIEGEGANKKATVFFEGIGQKILLLKFAKLEIVK
ncbi:MAG: UvrD-helicase domain-containing protein [Flavobacteriales bacterium]|nr:UvrD-helicase domain-containing protein [Flavobacteriales bacterium]